MTGTSLTTTEKNGPQHDPLSGSTTRETIERSVAEQRVADHVDGEERRPRELSESKSPPTKRRQIRDAIRASEVEETKRRGLDPNGAPAWMQAHPAALKAWGTAHPELRKIFLAQDEVCRNLFAGYGQRYGEIEQILATHRPTFNARGLNDAQAIDTVFRWVAALSHPSTAVDAFCQLAAQQGINLSALGVNHGDLIYENQQLKQALNSVAQTRQAQVDQEVASEVTAFVKKHNPTQEVKETMARFMKANWITLEEAHQLALTHLGVPSRKAAEMEAKRRASVSPRGSTSWGLNEKPTRGRKRDRLASGSSGGIKDALLDAFQKSRNGERA
jgi:hypothetical protein